MGDSTTSAVAGMETAKRAVENNFLSKISQERVDKLERRIKAGTASKNEILEYVSLKKDDHTSDYLVDRARNNPDKMTDSDWNKLDNYLKRYITESALGGESIGDIVKSVNNITSGNYYKGYGYAYALDEKYRNNLPSRWSLLGVNKSQEEKLYENLNAKYVNNPRLIKESFDMRAGESLGEATLLSVTGGGSALIAGAKTLDAITTNIAIRAIKATPKVETKVSQALQIATKYPKTTETLIAGTVASGFDIYNGNFSYENTLANYVLSGAKAGKTLSQQLSIDAIYTGLTLGNDPSKSDSDIKNEAIAKLGGTATSIGADILFMKKGIEPVKRVMLIEFNSGITESAINDLMKNNSIKLKNIKEAE